MFIRIKSLTADARYKAASISSFTVDGQSAVTKRWYITIVMGRTERKFAWATEPEMRAYEKYLDKVLDVKEV